MKAITRISTGEYEYLEIQEEVSSVDEAIQLNNRATSVYKAQGGGLDQKDWNNALDGYITLGTMPADIGERMSKAQSWMISELDKSARRVNPPEKRDIDYYKKTT